VIAPARQSGGGGRVFEWLSMSIPPGRLVFVGVVLASARLLCLTGRAILAWVQGRVRVAEIEATSRAELLKVHEAGMVLVLLAELESRREAARSGSPVSSSAGRETRRGGRAASSPRRPVPPHA
jgi:hypothetical protein